MEILGIIVAKFVANAIWSGIVWSWQRAASRHTRDEAAVKRRLQERLRYSRYGQPTR